MEKHQKSVTISVIVLAIYFVQCVFSISLPAQDMDALDDLSECGIIRIGSFGTGEDSDTTTLKVRVLRRGEDSLDVLIGMGYEIGHDNSIDMRYLRVEAKDYLSFKENISVVNEKYSKWTETAKSEGIKNFKKKIPVDFGEEVGYWAFVLYSQSFRYESTECYAIFEVDDEGNCTLRIDNVEEYKNKETNYHRPFFVFYSPEAFNALYNIISNVHKRYLQVKPLIDAHEKSIAERDSKFD